MNLKSYILKKVKRQLVTRRTAVWSQWYTDVKMVYSNKKNDQLASKPCRGLKKWLNNFKTTF